MAGYSKLVVVGHLTRDLELRFTTGGKAVANATIAINRKFRSSSGEAKEDVVFLDFVCFGERAEVFCKWLTKGKRVLLDGQLSQDNWEDKKTGQKRSKIKMSVEHFTFLDPTEPGEKGEQPAREARAPRPQPTAQAARSDNEDDDVPF